VHKPYFLGAIVTRDTAISTNLNQQFGSQNCADSEFLTVSWPFQVHSTCIQLDILGTFEPAAPAQFYIGKIKEKHPKCEPDSVPGAAEPWFSQNLAKTWHVWSNPAAQNQKSTAPRIPAWSPTVVLTERYFA
jgi:hypothetical protein